MQKSIENLLDNICVQLGFCLPPTEQEKIASQNSWQATEFAMAVISAEGLNPEYEKKWVKEISSRFTSYFGSSEYVQQNS